MLESVKYFLTMKQTFHDERKDEEVCWHARKKTETNHAGSK
jgi:hypothetical protein